MDADLRQRHLRLARLVKQSEHFASNFAQQRRWVSRRNRGGDHLSLLVDGDATRRQLLDRRARSKNFLQESHDADEFFGFFQQLAFGNSGGQPTRNDLPASASSSRRRSLAAPATCDSGPASSRSPRRPAASPALRAQTASCSPEWVLHASTFPWPVGGITTMNSAAFGTPSSEKFPDGLLMGGALDGVRPARDR